MNKRELTIMEELILNSMEFDTVCPYCGRAVHITPKDLIWQFGCTFRDKDGNITKKTPSGFLYKCECNKDIPIVISIGVYDERIEKKGE